jgi:glycosyltransferase involved in cell wall biosynthesis
LTPFFSIVTFVKNRKSKIRQCLDSILQQDLKDIELIIQDGASTDGTEKILRTYAKKYKNIKLVSEFDNSPSDAWFKALRRCKGQWIGLLMSDETYLPNSLKNVKGILRNVEKPLPSFVYGNGKITDYEGNYIGEARAIPNFTLESYLLNQNLPHPGNSFINRQALLKAGLLKRKWIWDCCEYEVYLRLAILEQPLYIPVEISNFAIHDSQLGANQNNLRKITEGEFLLFEKFFRSKEGIKYKKLENKAKINIVLRSLSILHSKNNFNDDEFYLKRLLNLKYNKRKIISLLYLRAQQISKINNLLTQEKTNSDQNLDLFIKNLVKIMTKNSKNRFYIFFVRIIKPFLRILAKK